MTLKELLARSNTLEKELLSHFKEEKISNIERHRLTNIICAITIEHANSMRLLVDIGNFTSAIGMLRLQYEAFVRAIWIYYAAKEIAVSKLADELTHKSAKSANRLPMLSEMLTQIEKAGPNQVVKMLNEIKDQSWKALNSYVHTGIHAVNRNKTGYPSFLIERVVKHSNNLCVLVTTLRAIMTNDMQIAFLLDRVNKEFADCIQVESQN